MIETPITMREKQETFDIVVEHARNQGKKSMGVVVDSEYERVFACAYRGENDCKCFAGALFPDEKYLPEFENTVLFTGWANIEITPVGLVVESEGHNIRLARKLQKIHDNKPVEEWETEFKRLAVEENLVYSAPQV